MTFDEYIDKHHRHQKHFTLDDMKVCWEASANNIGQAIVDLCNGKFKSLPHRSEDE